jgi:hypothetical protein
MHGIGLIRRLPPDPGSEPAFLKHALSKSMEADSPYNFVSLLGFVLLKCSYELLELILRKFQ